ncbi:hypothetical protein VTJ83DRAFT_1876 [Remersonia thermophila]|uniref:Cytochrome P450 n=1 Tax=Remersonia thermophila TaxID=72144 RepID=A0ABR4DH55_9PEZI
MEPVLRILSSMNLLSSAAVLALVSAIFLAAAGLWFSQRNILPFPPGPSPEPVLGHYRLISENAPFRQYARWSKEYKSDVLFFWTFGTKWVVLNSVAAAVELLEKRGLNYADRPRFVMFEEMGWGPTMTWLRWGSKYKLHRRALQPPFTRSRVGEYAGLQQREALRCCLGMLDRPDDWLGAVRRFAVAVVLKIAYGLDIDGPDSPWLKMAEDTSEAVGKSGAPASSIMDRFPPARYLPDWLPFMERLRYARAWRPAIEKITREPFEASLKAMSSGTGGESFVHTKMRTWAKNQQNGLASEFDLDDIQGAAATIVIAGNDTTAATLMLLVLYLMQNPLVQRRAQEEIDCVVGRDRLPTWSDLPGLQYVNLVLQETYRMNPLSPLGVPHASIADDVYRGMFIARGTIVYPNVWAMCHDETVYKDPFVFRPERYLPRDKGGDDEPLPVGNFGFGRRNCIGKHLAENGLLIVLSTLLATANIGWPLGEDGKPAPFEPEWSFRGQAIVLPFKASITSRSAESRALLEKKLAMMSATAQELGSQ